MPLTIRVAQENGDHRQTDHLLTFVVSTTFNQISIGIVTPVKATAMSDSSPKTSAA